MLFHPKNLKSKNNKPWFNPWFNILMHTQSVVYATVDSQCLEYLVHITLPKSMIYSITIIHYTVWMTLVFEIALCYRLGL